MMLFLRRLIACLRGETVLPHVARPVEEVVDMDEDVAIAQAKSLVLSDVGVTIYPRQPRPCGGVEHCVTSAGNKAKATHKGCQSYLDDVERLPSMLPRDGPL